MSTTPAIFGNDEVLEMGYGSRVENVLLVCPSCQTGRLGTKSTFSVICGKCGEYFTKEQSLSSEAAEGNLPTDRKIVTPEYLKFRKQMEVNAYNWRDKEIKAGRWRNPNVTHEPGGRPRRF